MVMKKYPSQEMERFNVRLPVGMRDAIAERAERHGRSMNSEIVQILSDAINNPERPDVFNKEDLETLRNILDKITENFPPPNVLDGQKNM